MNSSKIFLAMFLASIVFVGPITAVKSLKKNDSINNKIVVEEKIEEKVIDKEEKKPENIIPEVQQENVVKENTDKKEETIEATKDYFDDALFIGDSRTVGIMEYGNLENATFFANTGLSVYNVSEKVTSSPKVGKLKLEELLTNKKFGKIYIMLGINELGYNFNQTVKKYESLVSYVQKKQPDAIIYIEANLHVGENKSKTDKTFNNKNIDLFNNNIKKLADNKSVFYIDINEKFDDENGNLKSDYTFDQVHIYAKHYKEWSDWLIKNTKGDK